MEEMETRKCLLRKAEERDRERIWEILLQAKAQMRREGRRQWDEAYPSMEHVSADLARGWGHVLCDERGGVAACGAVVYDGEPAYERLDGRWLSEAPYVVVHRLAVAEEARHRGMALRFMQEVERMSRERGVESFKVDTNFDNLRMLHLLEKLGFVYCGEISYQQGQRKAFEKLLK